MTTSATEPAISAPSSRSRANGSGDRSNARTRLPLFFTRLRQIGSPITPRPMKPMVLYAAIAIARYFTNERDGGRCSAKASTLSLARG